jgi:uncharacterized membrane protein
MKLEHDPMNPESRPFELGKNRIEALSDGVFAIAMTLLVLDLRAPELPPNAPNVEVFPALLGLWPKFVSYAVSFVSLGVFWVSHHTMYHAVRWVDRGLLWFNIFFFMFVSLLPFSTSLLNAFPQTQVAPLFFGANLTIIGWLLFFQWLYVGRKRDMLAPFVTEEYRAAVRFRTLMVPIVMTFTMLICFWSVEISLTIYLTLLPFYMLPGKFDRRHSQTALSSSH